MITKENNGMSKRDSRLTADITEEAHDLLRGLVSKHEHGKGYFVEKMIRKFCVVEPLEGKPKPKKEPVKRFKKPTPEEVFNYCNERCNNINAEAFVDHYEANGWVQGKGKPVKDWKACIRTWEKTILESKIVQVKLPVIYQHVRTL